MIARQGRLAAAAGATLAVLSYIAGATAHAAEPAAEGAPAVSASLTGSWYAMRDQEDFGIAIGAIDVGSLRIETRHNYEARHATSVLVGWRFSGGDTIAWEMTPLIGALAGSTRGAIAGIEASVAYRAVDLYVEAEYVEETGGQGDSYFYAWTELAFRPVEWLRVGVVGQRTRVVDADRDVQPGVFGQVEIGKATIGVYAFNPDAASRYTVVSLGLSF